MNMNCIVMRIFIVLLFLIKCTLSIAQSGGINVWPALEPVIIDDSLKSEKAVILKYYQTYNFRNHGESSFIHFQRFYINSEEGAKSFQTRRMELPSDGELEMITGRIIKKDSSVFPVDENWIRYNAQIKKRPYTEYTFREVFIQYPNLEPGDIIDLVYNIEYPGYVHNKTLYLSDDLPVLQSRITLRNSSLYDLYVYNLDGFPAVSSQINRNSATYSVEKIGVPALSSGAFFYKPNAVPKLNINLWKKNSPLNYAEIYRLDCKKRNVKFDDSERFIDALGLKSTGWNTQVGMVNLLSLQKFLMEEMHFERNLNLPNIYLLKEYYVAKRINSELYMNFIECFLKETGIPYQVGFTNDIWEGQFQPKLISVGQLQKRFFIVQDEQGKTHYIFPPNSKGEFYLLDELPLNYEGNSAVILKGKDGVLQEAQILHLPDPNEHHNQQVSSLILQINPKNKSKVSGMRYDRFTGHFSSLLRTNSNSDVANELQFSSKPIHFARMEEEYPYELEFEQELIDSLVFNLSSNGSYRLQPAQFLPLGMFFEEEGLQLAEENVLLPFEKEHEIKVLVNSDSTMKVEDAKLDYAFENIIGSVSMKMEQLGEKSLKLTVRIKLYTRMLNTPYKIDAYKELLGEYDRMRKIGWNIRM